MLPIPVEVVLDIDTVFQPLDYIVEFNHMIFEALQVANTFPNKLRANELSALMPLLSICTENTITKEILPVQFESGTLSKIMELSRQDRFDILWIGREDHSFPEYIEFYCIRSSRVMAPKYVAPVFVDTAFGLSLDSTENAINSCNGRRCLVFRFRR